MTNDLPATPSPDALTPAAEAPPATTAATSPTGTGTETGTEGGRLRRMALPKPTKADRWGMNPEDRLRVMEACLLLQRRGWKTNFALMMAMAAIVAGMGLAANSPALVIGAMLIAPLMTPVLGVAASIAMVLGEALIRSVITVVLATSGVIGLGWLVGLLLPGDLMQSGEVLARTSPDIKDLVVAIAAGLAGAYATARPDMSSSLPGVAVAVALVPPLMVVGITAEAGEFAVAGGAGGALLLYLTNLAGIITVATAVFVVTGFVPSNRLARLGPRVLLGIGIGALTIVALSIPLFRTFRAASSEADLQNKVSDVVRDWNGTTANDFDDIELKINDSAEPFQVAVEVTGFDQPPTEESLERSLTEVLGRDVQADVRWTQAQRASSDKVIFDEDEVRAVVERWTGEWVGDHPWELVSVALVDNDLKVDVRSNIDAPGVEALAAALQEELGANPSVELEWNPLIDPTGAELERAVTLWAANSDVVVRDLSFDGAKLELEVTGSTVPPTEALKAELASIAGPPITAADVQVWFVQRVLAVPSPTPVPPTPDPNAPWFERVPAN